MTIRSQENAFALVSTLFVVVLLSTITVAFLTSMNLERRIAKSIQSKYQAELAAEAGMQDFLARLENIKIDGPYSAVYVLGSNTNPYLFLGKRIFSSNGTTTKRVPLFSTGVTNFNTLTNFDAAFLSSSSIVIQDIDQSGTSVYRTLSNSNDIWCDINKTNARFPSGLVGLRNTFTNTNAIPSLSVNWVYIKNSVGKVIARYAYWADDECSKIDIRYAGSSNNLSGNHNRSNGAFLSELALTPLTNAPNATSNLSTNNLSNLLAFTNSDTHALPFTPAHTQYPITNNGNLTTAQWEAIKPFVTIYSQHDERSPDGKRRVNLNALITSTTSAAEMAFQTLTIRDAITNNLPTFGERFYSAANGTATVPTIAHQKAYVTRIAANIRDFVDSDNNATIINNDDTAYAGNAVNFTKFEGIDDDLPLAFGKEGGLFLSEYFRVSRVIESTPETTSSIAPVNITIRFGHYVELSNFSGKTITSADLGSDPHIILGKRAFWQNAFTSTPLRLADVKMRLPADLSIPPSGFVCLTTDGGSFPSGSQTNVLGNAVIQLSHGTEPGQWTLENTNGTTPIVGGSLYEDYNIKTGATGNGTTLQYEVYNSTPDDKESPTYTDQRERLIIANNSGIIDCSFRIYSTLRRYLKPGIRNPIWISTFLNDGESETGNNTPTADDKDPRYTRGDLRSNCDIVSFNAKGTGIVWKQAGDGTGTNLYSGSSAIQQQTLGSLNYNYDKLPTYRGNLVAAWRKGWYEYTIDPAGNHFVKNTNLTSLAELGYVYDPVRHDIEGYRSMGATLRIGQSDSPTNNRATNAGTDFQNWLGGRGSDSPTNTAYAKNAFLLMDVFRTDTNTSGRINPNSVVRDGLGVVLQSALRQFVYEGNPTNGASSLLGNQTLNPTNTVSAIRDFVTNSTNGFIVSVGDLSRIPAFWGTNNSTTNIVPGTRMSAVSDAGKEEFLRRTANLLTTQSLAYSIYIVGQTGEIQTKSGADAFIPTSTAITEKVIQLEPVYPSTINEQPIAPSEWRTLNPKSISY